MIRNFTPQDSKAYLNFLNSFEDDYLFYAQPTYIKTILKAINSNNETLVYEENGEIKGIFPLLSKDGELGKVYNSLPFYGSHGGAIAKDNEVIQKLYNHVLDPSFGGDSKALVMISENPFVPIDSGVGFQNDVIIEDRIVQVSPLQGITNEDDLMSIFHYKTRNMVRKSLKSGFKLLDSPDLFEPMYDLHIENMQAIGGTIKPKSFYESVTDHYIYGEDYKLVGAEYEGKLAGVLLLFYFNGVVDYHTPTINVEYRNLQPNSFLIYRSMLDAVNQGLKYWNWGGTWKTQESLYRFKNRWGAKDLDYRYIIKIGNQEVLKSDPDILLKEYPFFFTVPFDMLTKD